jgi:hypothetical protein
MTPPFYIKRCNGVAEVGGNTIHPPPPKRHVSKMSFRNWIFTSYEVESPIVFPEWVRYAIYQKELCPSTSRVHYQGYMELTKPARMSYLKSNISDKWHYETRKGSRDQAKNYCRKEDTRIDGPWEHGSEPNPGQRTDLQRLETALQEGKTTKQICEEDFTNFAKYSRVIKEYKLVMSEPRDFKTEVYILVGKPGTGKSRYCRKNAPDAYWKSADKWWDAYEGQPDVVFDDYYGYLTWTTLLQVCDRYPLQVEMKGGKVNFRAKRVFITSNKPMEDWYDKEKYDIAALQRRVTLHITDLTQDLINID